VSIASPYNTVLFVTYEFPFGNGETFIESEIGPVSESFERCYIMPSRAWFSPNWRDLTKTVRPLPKNCEIFLPDEKQTKNDCFMAKSIVRFLLQARDNGDEKRVRGFLQEAVRESIKAALFLKGLHRFIASHPEVCLMYTYWKGPASLALASIKSNNPNLRLVTRCHHADLYYDLSENKSRPHDHLVSSIFDLVLPISIDGQKHLIYHGFTPSKTLVSRLGVNIPSSISRKSDDETVRIVSCANLLPIKRVPMLAKALAGLSRPFIWTHYGDGVEMPAVQAIVSKFPSHGRANLPGRVPNEEVVRHYVTDPVDLFVHASSSEGVPVSIMEALAAGIPCIATDAGGTAEIVDDGVGRLLPVNTSAEELRRAIEAVLSSTDGRRELRAAARQRAIERCDAGRNYRDFVSLITGAAQLRGVTGQ
jgi:glycosyltransferase involved in cell wall biosynthesis